MPAIVVVGGHWGDEGKGKVIDLLSEQATMVVRYNGGHNAGHTVRNPLGEFAMHIIPCGIFHESAVCVIGNGVAFSPQAFLKELAVVHDVGVSTEGRLFVSDQAHLIMPYHPLLDHLDEIARGESAIGTLQLGIGPLYTDKATRIGLRVGDLLNPAVFREQLSFALERKNQLITKVYDHEPLELEPIYEEYLEYGRQLAPYIRETGSLVRSAISEDKLVLLEGAQGTLLDLEHGTYPYVTSSLTSAGGAGIGSGIPPTKITKALGVFKAYTTRVGGGPLPTELYGQEGDDLRERGHEYGTTSGRGRRCGWFDAVAGRYSTEVNDFTSVALVRLDVLDIYPVIKICTGYKLDGRVINEFPTKLDSLERCTPVYEEIPGWLSPTSEARQFTDLPAEAQHYVRRLEALLKTSVDVIGVGPGREQSICLRPVI